MQRPVDLFLPLLAQKGLQRQQQRFLPFVHFSRLSQHCGGRIRQRLLLKNGLQRLRLRFRGVRHGRALRLRLRHGKAHRSGQLPQLLQLRGIIQYGAQRALQLIH